MQNPFRQKNGYTLIEMLLVVSMLAMVGVALFHTFINGLKIWERSRQFIVEEDVAIFFDKVGEDLRNSFLYSQIPFQGRETGLSFAGRIKTLEAAHNRFSLKMGEIGYEFDPLKKRVIRRQADYGQAVKHIRGSERVLVEGIEGVRFSYYLPEGTAFVLQNKSDSIFPAAVAIEVEFKDKRGTRLMKKFINLPVGS